MHKPSENLPTQAQLIYPLLDLIAANGGSMKAADAADALAERFTLPSWVTSATTVTRDGQVVNMYQRTVRFVRQKAKDMGYVDSERRGADWRVTDAGMLGLQHATPGIVVEILTTPDGVPRAARLNLSVGVPTTHLLVHGDSRNLDWLDSGSIPLVVTSVPYFDLVTYESGEGQLAELESYDAFLEALMEMVAECYRVLTPGGRLALNVGDPLRSRAKHGEHHVLPLHADILSRSTRMGFRALTGILWNKIGNVAYEEGGAGVLGRPGCPNGVIKAEIEHILLLRRPGPYRSVNAKLEADSRLDKEEYQRCFRAIWDDIPGARANKGHPAPFPIEIPRRLISMFSHRQDTILDVAAGSFTTAVAAARMGRNSIGVDAALPYVNLGVERLKRAHLELACA